MNEPNTSVFKIRYVFDKKCFFQRYSTMEYYTMTGPFNYQRSLEKEQINSNIKKMETDIFTGKAANVINYEKCTKHMLSNLTSIFQFYGPNRYNKRRRKSTKLNRMKHKKKAKKKCRQTTTSSEENMENEDNDPIPLVVFGAGNFGKDQVKFKGLQSRVTGILWRALKKRENDISTLILVTSDQYGPEAVVPKSTNQTQTYIHVRTYLSKRLYIFTLYTKCHCIFKGSDLQTL
ncbi:hypothetical protein K501DRAFT_276553 [Backusella circina FSU 941]|nr:hypothetical protein K501DRAFT_276553 [Backusella circina FSU 941]